MHQEEDKEKIKRIQSIIHAESISPGTFAMLLGVHVRFRTSTDPEFDDPEFLTSPMSGECKPESLMITEYLCLTDEVSQHQVDTCYNPALTQCHKENKVKFDLDANTWTSYPDSYSKSVRGATNQLLTEYKECTSTLDTRDTADSTKDTRDSTRDSEVFLKPIYEFMKSLDVYSFMSPGLFTLMLGVHAKFPKTQRQAENPDAVKFTGECKSSNLMAMELVTLIKIAHQRPHAQEMLDLYNTKAKSEYHKAAVITTMTQKTVRYATVVSNFLKRVLHEYCGKSPGGPGVQKSPGGPKSHETYGKIFICDNDAITDHVNPEYSGDIELLCDTQLCDKTDPITYEDLEDDAVKLIVGGKPICYNRNSIKRSLESSQKEPFNQISFLPKQSRYLGVEPPDYPENADAYTDAEIYDDYDENADMESGGYNSRDGPFGELIYRQELLEQPRHEGEEDALRKEIRLMMERDILSHAHDQGIELKSISAFNPGSVIFRRLRDYDDDTLVYTSIPGLWNMIYYGNDLMNCMSPDYDSQSRTLIDSFMKEK